MVRTILFVYLVAVGLAVALALFTVLSVTVIDLPVDVTADSLVAVAAWAQLGTALATLLLVVGTGGAVVLTAVQFLTAIRPHVVLERAEFTADGLSVDIENTSGGRAVTIAAKVWVAFVAATQPSPRQLGDAVIAVTDEFARGESPHFEGPSTGLPGESMRSETLRMGPRASEYDPAWAGGFGIALFEIKATDALGNESATSGWVEVSP